MNTPELLSFFSGPVSVALGTVGSDRRPAFVRPLGVTGVVGTKQICAMVPAELAGRAIDDLKENPNLALTIADVTNLQTRQFKGKLVAVRDATEEEQVVARTTIEIAKAPLTTFFGPVAAVGWERYYIVPLKTFVLEYSSVFDQTPGPDAGRELK